MGTSLVTRCPPSSANLSEANLAFKASPRAWQAKSSSVPTPPPIQISSLVAQEVSTGHPMALQAPLPRAEAQGRTPRCPTTATATEPLLSLPGGRGSPLCPLPFPSQPPRPIGPHPGQPTQPAQPNQLFPGQQRESVGDPLVPHRCAPCPPGQPEPGIIKTAQTTEEKALSCPLNAPTHQVL